MAIDLLYSYDFVIIRDHSLLIAGGGVGRFWETTWFFRENGGGISCRLQSIERGLWKIDCQCGEGHKNIAEPNRLSGGEG